MLSINEKRKLNASDDIFKILSEFKKDNNYSSLDKEKQKLISQLGFPNQIVIDKIKKAYLSYINTLVDEDEIKTRIIELFIKINF